MTKKQRLATMVLGIAVIIVLLLIVFLEMQDRQAGQIVGEDAPTPGTGGNVYVPDNDATVRPHDWEETEFRQPVPVDIKVPELGENLPAELVDVVALPEQSIEIPMSEDSNFRVFRIRAENNQFTPSQVIANFGDSINIQLMAIDKDYDLVLSGYNMLLKAKQGETRPLQFQANKDGRFIYYCDSCGGPESTARGEIIVVK